MIWWFFFSFLCLRLLIFLRLIYTLECKNKFSLVYFMLINIAIGTSKRTLTQIIILFTITILQTFFFVCIICSSSMEVNIKVEYIWIIYYIFLFIFYTYYLLSLPKLENILHITSDLLSIFSLQ